MHLGRVSFLALKWHKFSSTLVGKRPTIYSLHKTTVFLYICIYKSMYVWFQTSAEAVCMSMSVDLSRVGPIYFSLKKKRKKKLWTETELSRADPNCKLRSLHVVICCLAVHYCSCSLFCSPISWLRPDGLGGRDVRFWKLQRRKTRENCTTRRFVVNFLTIIRVARDN